MLCVALGIVRCGFWCGSQCPRQAQSMVSVGLTGQVPHGRGRDENLAVTLPIYSFGFFGLPPFRPLRRDCSLPASVFGPELKPPCHLQRPLK